VDHGLLGAVVVRDEDVVEEHLGEALVAVEAAEPAHGHALRAEGHYTILYHRSEKLFCPWSISDAEKRLAPGFLRVHRSYLINPRLLTGLDMLKDTGLCFFDGVEPPLRVPVSRSHLKAVREALGL
jgi:DNA-binding LytR/AlgR family response regulator